MILKRDTLEIQIHSANLISIKDLSGDIDIRDLKWSFIFDFLTNKQIKTFFNGHRIWNAVDKNLVDSIDLVALRSPIIKDDLSIVFFEIDAKSFSFFRNRISILWSYYEYPAIIFLENEYDQNELESICSNSYYVNELIVKIPNLYCIYQSFELDVLWITSGNSLISGSGSISTHW